MARYRLPCACTIDISNVDDDWVPSSFGDAPKIYVGGWIARLRGRDEPLKTSATGRTMDAAAWLKEWNASAEHAALHTVEPLEAQ